MNSVRRRNCARLSANISVITTPCGRMRLLDYETPEDVFLSCFAPDAAGLDRMPMACWASSGEGAAESEQG